MYCPHNLSRGIYDATFVLKQKCIDKIPKLKFPPRIKEKYDLAFKFHLPKFPPLPTSDFRLAFSHPPPKWYPFGSLKVLENEFKKLAQRVVSTNYYTHNYIGPLNVDIEHV